VFADVSDTIVKAGHKIFTASIFKSSFEGIDKNPQRIEIVPLTRAYSTRVIDNQYQRGKGIIPSCKWDLDFFSHIQSSNYGKGFYSSNLQFTPRARQK
jgi:hypothetical protein